MKKLSVIIPVYNVESYLPKCLDSLILPGREDEYEIIAVNDGSTDGSLSVLNNYVNLYPGLITAVTTENMGQGNARNVGVDMAQGVFIYFIDSDDYLAPGGMEKILDAAEGSYDVCIFDSIAVNTDGLELEYRKGCHLEGDLDPERNPAIILENPDVWNKIFRRSLFTDNAIRFPSRVWFEDLRTVPKVYRFTSKVIYIPRAWHRYLQRPDSVTNTSKVRRNLEIIPAVEDVLEFYRCHGRAGEMKDELEYLAFYCQFLTSSVRANLSDPTSDVQEILMTDFLRKFPDYKNNPYVRKMGIKHKLLTWLLMHRMRRTVHMVMKLNNTLKNKKV